MTNNEMVARFYHHDHTRGDEFAKKIRTLQDVGYVLDSLDVDNVLPLTPTTSGFVDETEIIETVQGLFSYLSGMQLYPVVYEGGIMVSYCVMSYHEKAWKNKLALMVLRKVFCPM